MHDLYTREKFDWEPLNPFSLSLHEIRAQGSTFNAVSNDRGRLLSRRSVSCIYRVFSSRPAFRYFLATASQRTAPAVLPYWDLVLFRIGNLILILRRELSERPLSTRNPEIAFQ